MSFLVSSWPGATWSPHTVVIVVVVVVGGGGGGGVVAVGAVVVAVVPAMAEIGRSGALQGHHQQQHQ